MQIFPSFSTFIAFGSLEVRYYAIFIMSGAIIAYKLAERTGQKWGYPKGFLEDYFIGLMICAILGARLWYVIFEWQQYSYDPLRIITHWTDGGLAFHGGLIAGLVFSYLYFKKKKISLLRMADAILPNVLLAQAFGRWGNFFNQEAYGSIVSESYYRFYPAFIKDHMYINGEYRQPTFLFESIANIIGWLLIRFVYKRYGRKKRGDEGFAYMAWYGVTRFVIESFRTDSLYMFGTIRTAQLVSIVLVVIGVCGIAGVFNRLFAKTSIFKSSKPVIIFDLDGTLLDTHELINQSYFATLGHYRPDYVITQEDIDGFAGPTLEQTFSRFSDDPQEIEEWITYYREFNHRRHDDFVKEVDGVSDVLKWLKEHDYKMGIVSNKPQVAVKLGLDLFNLNEYFEVVLGCYDFEEAKPSPSGILKACEVIGQGHDDVIYIGDAVTDVRACKNMGAFSIAFILDKKYEESMKAEKPCEIIYNMSELIEIVQEEREWSDNTIL